MTSNFLSDLHSTASGFSQIARLYDENKSEFCKKIPVSFYAWFDANMAAPLGDSSNYALVSEANAADLF